MSDQMTRIQQEAEEGAEEQGYNVLPSVYAYKKGFIAGRTVTSEQVEKAAKEVWRHQVGADTSGFYKHTYAHTATKCMDTARAAFAAAGFYVEGEE